MISAFPWRVLTGLTESRVLVSQTMPKEILINVRSNQTRIACVDNGVLSDLKVERHGLPTFVGSIFKGKVLKVLPGMQSAFIDIGLDRAAFLYVGDIRGDLSEEKSLYGGDEEGDVVHEGDPPEESLVVEQEVQPLIQDLLKEGQMIMVQVAKDPLGTKGAQVTTHISFPGRLLVYMPTLQHVGISRRIDREEERDRLKGFIQKINPKGGIIVRTASEGAQFEGIKFDFECLRRMWSEVQKNYGKRKTAGLIHSELSVELRALRDLLSEDVDQVIVDDAKAYKRVSQFVSQFMPKYREKIHRFKGAEPLFDRYDIDLEISRALSPKVWLKSGGYIVIDEAEALVAIDINTGRFVGKKDFEDTVLKTNLEAAKEIAHQLKIRNCGGIIIIDFIDMEKELHREKVLQVLQEELCSDRVRTEITSMSGLGLVEMTRKRTRPSLTSRLCKPCNYCDGKGYIKSCSTVASEVFREIEREALKIHSKASILIQCHGDLADWVYGSESEALEALEKRVNRPISFKVRADFHIEQFEITIP